jgi:hypothetical protein
MAGSNIYAGSEFQQACKFVAETTSWSKSTGTIEFINVWEHFLKLRNLQRIMAISFKVGCMDSTESRAFSSFD